MSYLSNVKKLQACQAYFDAKQNYRKVFKNANSTSGKKEQATERYCNAEWKFIDVMQCATIAQAIELAGKL